MPWTYDANHSNIVYETRHFGISIARGRFTKAEITLEVDEADLTRSSVVAVIDPASVNTDIERRDEQLRGPIYLDVERFPTIEFRSTRIEANGPAYTIFGNLTLHGTTHEVALAATFNGEMKDNRGNRRRGFSARTRIRRSDFGVSTTLVNGCFMAADDIDLFFEVEATLQD